MVHRNVEIRKKDFDWKKLLLHLFGALLQKPVHARAHVICISETESQSTASNLHTVGHVFSSAGSLCSLQHRIKLWLRHHLLSRRMRPQTEKKRKGKKKKKRK